jgi:hypothetical protein
VPSHGLADTYRCQEPNSLAVAGHVRYLLLSGQASLDLHTSGTHVQDACQSSFAAFSHSRCLEVIFGDHERTLASSLLKMEAEVNSQLGRSWIAMKNKKPRLHLCLGHGLVYSK